MRWRTFLEPVGKYVDSYVVVDVESWHIKLKIADCDRSVKLYFTPSSEKHRKAMLAKVEKLQRALDAVEAAIVAWKIGQDDD